jgi:hypothetical protein
MDWIGLDMDGWKQTRREMWTIDTVSIDSKLKNTMLVIIIISADKNPSEYAPKPKTCPFSSNLLGFLYPTSSPWEILGETIRSFVPCWSSC